MGPITLTPLGTVQGYRVLAIGRRLHVLVLDGVLVLAPSTLCPKCSYGLNFFCWIFYENYKIRNKMFKKNTYSNIHNFWSLHLEIEMHTCSFGFRRDPSRSILLQDHLYNRGWCFNNFIYLPLFKIILSSLFWIFFMTHQLIFTSYG